MNLAKAKNVDRYVGNLLCAIFGILLLIRKVIFQKSAFEPKSIKKILLIKFWGLGNMTFLMPTFKAVRDTFKEAEIDFLTISSNKNIMQTYSHVDSLYLIDTSTFLRFLASLASVLRKIRDKKFDIVLDFEVYVRISATISFLSATGFKIGISPKKLRGLLYDDGIIYDKNVHITKTYADLVKRIGVQIAKIEPIKIIVTDKDIAVVDDFLKRVGLEKDEVIVGMHIGSGDNFLGRRWPKDNFALLANTLVDKYNCKIFFTGSAKERGIVRDLVRTVNENKNFINTAGQFTSRQLAYLLGKLTLFISNDTGPLHIASCMGTPVVGLYGPNTPLIYGPIGKNAAIIYKSLKCSPCITNLNSKTSYCRNFKCMEKITVEEVMETARLCLGR